MAETLYWYASSSTLRLSSMVSPTGMRPSISPDPAVFASVPMILVGVAIVALLVPAFRATKVDPVRTLGEE